MRVLAFVLVLALAATGCTSVPERTQAFASGRIAVTTRGAGPDVILLAGAGAKANEVWDGTITRVPGYRYHVVQVAGFAGVPAGPNADGQVVEPVAEEVARYIRERGLRQPAVVGLSMGGTVGMLVAARHPDLVSRLMVVDMIPFMGAFYGPPGGVDSAEAARPIAEGVRAGTLAETPDARRANLTGMVAKMARTEAERPRLVENGVASDPRVMAGVMYDMILLDLRGELQNIRVPVTVLYVHAPLIRLDAAQTDAIYRTMFSTVPNARLARIDDAYHFIMLDQPQRFAAELKGFLAP